MIKTGCHCEERKVIGGEWRRNPVNFSTYLIFTGLRRFTPQGLHLRFARNDIFVQHFHKFHLESFWFLSRIVERGGMAEWPNATVLKTVVPQGTGGSNPSPSASLRSHSRGLAQASTGGPDFLFNSMWFVYVIKSEVNGHLYVGSTNNVQRRLTEHNEGKNISTKGFIPWKLMSYVAVNDEAHARNLEKYFKTGSGKAILKQRILPTEAWECFWWESEGWPSPSAIDILLRK